MRFTFLGHSCVLIETASARLVIDPFLTGNPQAALRAEDLRCTHVLVTHGHEDHIGDALAVSRANQAPIIANHEIAEYLAAQGATTHGMNPGGAHRFAFGRVKLTPAIHSSSIQENGRAIYLGEPCGIVIEADGKRLYHAGDTALFSDLRLVARGGLDLAVLPIGDNYTMGPEDALEALDLLTPRLTVPVHYDTWPVIAADADAFARAAATRGHAVRPLAPGESIDL